MNADDYAAFMAAHHGPYAADRMQADHFTQEEADAFVRKQNADVLPQGLTTPDHHFYNSCVWTVWIALSSSPADRPSAACGYTTRTATAKHLSTTS